MPPQDKQSNDIQRFYRVFISSTFKDLQEHRTKAMLAIVSAGHMPLCLENWTPQTKTDLDVIRNAVAECQFYVIILGHRYGSVPKVESKSYIEIELDCAEKAGLEILPFVMDDQLVNH